MKIEDIGTDHEAVKVEKMIKKIQKDSKHINDRMYG